MNAGDLRHYVIVQKKTTTKDADGVKTETWNQHRALWAAVSDLSGREFYAAAAVQMERTLKFTTRYYADITTAMRILYDGEYYHIDQVDRLQHRGDWMIMRARLVESEAGQ